MMFLRLGQAHKSWGVGPRGCHVGWFQGTAMLGGSKDRGQTKWGTNCCLVGRRDSPSRLAALWVDGMSQARENADTHTNFSTYLPIKHTLAHTHIHNTPLPTYLHHHKGPRVNVSTVRKWQLHQHQV